MSKISIYFLFNFVIDYLAIYQVIQSGLLYNLIVFILNKNEKETAVMLENKFQSNLIKEIKDRFPGCIVMKNDSSYIQGIPDLLVLYKDKWASLEVKKSANAKHQPNQDYYVNKMKDMSYSSFISPENKNTVFNELKNLFEG